MDYNQTLSDELNAIDLRELTAAVILMQGVASMEFIKDFLTNTKPESNFANALANWDTQTDSFLIRNTCMELFKDQYPGLHKKLESDYGNDSNLSI